MLQRGLVHTNLGYIHYRRAGSGPAVMLFHINQQSSALMVELIEALADKFDVIAMDYPSHGVSDHLSWQPAIGDYVRAAVEILDALQVTTSFAIGEGVGAAVAIELARAQPERVPRIALVNCPFLEGVTLEASGGEPTQDQRPSDSSGFPLTRTMEFVIKEDPEHAPTRPTQSWMDRVNTAQMEAGRDRWQAIRALRGYSIGESLEEIQLPILALMGENFYFKQHYSGMMAKIANGTSHIIKGANFCVTWEYADEVARKASDFFQKS